MSQLKLSSAKRKGPHLRRSPRRSIQRVKVLPHFLSKNQMARNVQCNLLGEDRRNALKWLFSSRGGMTLMKMGIRVTKRRSFTKRCLWLHGSTSFFGPNTRRKFAWHAGILISLWKFTVESKAVRRDPMSLNLSKNGLSWLIMLMLRLFLAFSPSPFLPEIRTNPSSLSFLRNDIFYLFLPCWIPSHCVLLIKFFLNPKPVSILASPP